ncbi:unnamed protein product, partial [Didymodactylos carnosus]
IHQIIGHDLVDVFSICKNVDRHGRKEIKGGQHANSETFTTQKELTILGTDNKLYRGRIDSCKMALPQQKRHAKVRKQAAGDVQIPGTAQTNVSTVKEHNINLEEFDFTIRTLADEYLFEYFDWRAQFDEQDLPKELQEDLFQHWKTVVCDDRPCTCTGECDEKFLNDEEQKTSPIRTINDAGEKYDTMCLCSDCSCECEKYINDGSDDSLCICSECSCKCLKKCSREFSNSDSKLSINEESTVNVLLQQQNSTLEQPSLIYKSSCCDDLPLVKVHHQCECNDVEDEDQKYDEVADQVKQPGQATNQEGRLCTNHEDISNVEKTFLMSECFDGKRDRWTDQFDIYQANDTLPMEFDKWIHSVTNGTHESWNPTRIQTAPVTYAQEHGTECVFCEKLKLDDPAETRQRLMSKLCKERENELIKRALEASVSHLNERKTMEISHRSSIMFLKRFTTMTEPQSSPTSIVSSTAFEKDSQKQELKPRRKMARNILKEKSFTLIGSKPVVRPVD